MTFILIALTLWLFTAFFTWALCAVASHADDLADETRDREGWR